MSTEWRFREPSLTCETRVGDVPNDCGAPAAFAYPAMGGGYMALCVDHAQKHLAYCVPIEAAKRGEVPTPGGPTP